MKPKKGALGVHWMSVLTIDMMKRWVCGVWEGWGSEEPILIKGLQKITIKSHLGQPPCRRQGAEAKP